MNNKADFILEYNEHMDKNLRRDDVDWSQSRVIFIAPQFTTYQLKSIEFKDLAFELWEVNRFSNDTFFLIRLNHKIPVNQLLPLVKAIKMCKRLLMK